MTPDSSPCAPLNRKRSTAGLLPALAAIIIASSLALPGYAATAPLNTAAQTDISSIMSVKKTFSVGEKKLSTVLAFASRKALGKSVGAAESFINPTMATKGNLMPVVIKGQASAALLANITARGGSVQEVSPGNDRIEATLPIDQLEGLAARSEVRSIRQPPLKSTNKGSVTSQGYISHWANQTAAIGQIGTGVKVGVLSDSALPAEVAALIASGDLGPNTTVLPNQKGPSNGTNEGTAMMEIVQDLAPGCQVYFATAYKGESSFAANILALGAAGCKVIVDDVSYDDEFAFQDSIIAQAVNKFVASGGIYFSSAGNSGGATYGESSTWEGDFTDGGLLTSGVIRHFEGVPVYVHKFATGHNSTQLLNQTDGIVLFWADPIGGSGNDYDLFVFDSTGQTLKGFSADYQSGSDDPIEEIGSIDSGGNYANPAAGDQIVVVRATGSAKVAIHVESLFGESLLSIATDGQTHGHNAAASAQTIAATYWNSARTGVKPFDGADNFTEIFSSDGPRKIFFKPSGTPITPGNFRFATNGGLTLQKPDFTAADGVNSKTPGFTPFFGTSAAAPHAAAVAALIWAARPSLTNAQVVAIMRSTAMDNMYYGPDRDGGYGVVNAYTAVKAALAFVPPPAP